MVIHLHRVLLCFNCYVHFMHTSKICHMRNVIIVRILQHSCVNIYEIRAPITLMSVSDLSNCVHKLGTLFAMLQFEDDDRKCHMELKYSLEIKKSS